MAERNDVGDSCETNRSRRSRGHGERFLRNDVAPPVGHVDRDDDLDADDIDHRGAHDGRPDHHGPERSDDDRERVDDDHHHGCRGDVDDERGEGGRAARSTTRTAARSGRPVTGSSNGWIASGNPPTRSDFGRTTQNSLPSGSANTVHDSSPR
jgi:hypothetical protein